MRLERTARELVLTVEDDGRGISDHAPRGVGLESMRARAEELGGEFLTRTGSEGTRVEARLPL